MDGGAGAAVLTPFHPPHPTDGYLPIEDRGATAASGRRHALLGKPFDLDELVAAARP